MPPPYRYDLADLDRVASGLTALADDYQDAGREVAELGEAAGSPYVRDALRDFTDGWSRRRDKQTRMLRSAGEVVRGIADGYREGDEGGAARLRAVDGAGR